jgi:hypothetical protein
MVLAAVFWRSFLHRAIPIPGAVTLLYDGSAPGVGDYSEASFP